MRIFPPKVAGTIGCELDGHARQCCRFFFFKNTATTEIYPLSLHDALPIYPRQPGRGPPRPRQAARHRGRSEEHTSELQSHSDLVCRLLLEKKKLKYVYHARAARCPRRLRARASPRR